MNWQRELNKPIFINSDGRFVTLAEAKARLHESTALNASYRTMPKVLTTFASRGFSKFAAASEEEQKRLAVARLKSEPTRQFRFLDGTVFTAAQAVEEIERRTPQGDYFLKLEERAIELAEEALAKGQIP